MATEDNVVSGPKDKQVSDERSNAGQPGQSEDSAAAKNQDQQKQEAGITAATNAEIEKLQEQLRQAEDKAAKHWDEVLRSKAELENTRKRMERDIENAHKFAVEKFIQDLLPVIDSLEMGINAASELDADINKVKEGTALTLKMFNDCANKFGVQSINPKGEVFNPDYHQAVSIQQSNEYKPDTVMAVMQKGYLLNGRLVRPAMVVVAKQAEKPATEAGKKATDQQQKERENTEKQG